MPRALHYVFKIGNRKASRDFFLDVMRMKVLRHEEFYEGCKATCNGPYDGKWSKTMVGYGSEADHFVLELTFNYPVSSYELGNDFEGIYIQSSEVLESCRKHNLGKELSNGYLKVVDPDGHAFYIRDGQHNGDPIYAVALNTNNLEKTVDYWSRLLGMEMLSRDDKSCALNFESNQCQLLWKEIPTTLRRGSGFGRIAFAIPTDKLEPLQAAMEKEKQVIQTPLVKLDTPDKAAVQVVILADPNEHEICFVGEEAFSELSLVDPDGDRLLITAIEENKR